MKIMKRLFSLLMAVSLCLSLVLSGLPPIRSRAAAYSGKCGDSLTWELDSDGTLLINGSGNMENYEVEFDIWDDDDGYVSTAPWHQSSVKHVVIGEGVTSIGAYAFYDCYNLTDVTVPDSIANIASSAFSNGPELTYNLYDQGKYLGNETNPYVALVTTTAKDINNCFLHPDTKMIADEAFANCTGLTYVTIPEEVHAIGVKAFYGCAGLTRVTVPDRMIAIGNEAFTSCPNLIYHVYDQGKYLGNATNPYVALVDTKDESITDCTIHPYTKSIGASAFLNCNKLSSIIIPENVLYIGGGAFYGCDQLQNVYFVGDAPIFGIFERRESWGESPMIPVYIDYGPFACVSATAYYHMEKSGWDLVTTADLCGNGRAYVQVDQMTLVEDHIVTQYTYQDNATCTSDATGTGICLSCGITVIKPLEGTATGHTCSYVSNNDATCTTDGTKTGVCTACFETVTVPDPGSALGHTFTDYVSDQNATCTADGTKTRYCSLCGETETVSVPGSATGHSFTNYVPDGNATCTADGTKTKCCTACGETETVSDPGSATGHSFTNYVSDGNATCTADGTKTARCDYCSVVDIQVDVGSMGHRYFEGYCIYCAEAQAVPVSICGSLTAFGTADPLLELISKDGTADYFFVPVGPYRLDGIVSGDYTLIVSQTGSVSRTYDLEVGAEDLALDLKLHLPGDINGDGRRNIGDVVKIFSHVKACTLLTDYALLCADVTGEGRVNMGDVAMAYASMRAS